MVRTYIGVWVPGPLRFASGSLESCWMRRIQKGAAILAMLAMPMGCVRFELEGGDEADTEVAATALRITDQDSVVLCPLAANLETSGEVSIVWAGYPAADDRLQLMHARVSSRGELLQEATGLALLPDEVALLSIQASADGDDGGQEIHAVSSDGRETLRIELSKDGVVGGMYRDAIAVEDQDHAIEALSDERCEAAVRTSSSRLHILRTHVDGELPLFVESFSL